MAYDSLDSRVYMLQRLISQDLQSIKDTAFSVFFISLCLLSKKKNIDVVYITDKNHQYSVLNNFAMNRINLMPIPPMEQTPLYTVYFTYL